MNNMNMNTDIYTLFRDLRERRKELECLFQLEELLHNQKFTDLPLEDLFHEIIRIIPNGWQFVDAAQAKIIFKGSIYSSPGYVESPWQQTAELKVHNTVVGELVVSYNREVPKSAGDYFLKEEEQLIKAIADRISHMALHKELKNAYRQWQEVEEKLSRKSVSEWRVIVDLLQNSNSRLFMYLSQKMLQYLCWNGVAEAKELLQQTGGAGMRNDSRKPLHLSDMNQPSRKESLDKINNIYNEIFHIASESLNEEQLLLLIRQWLEDDKSRFLVKALENPNSSLNDLLNVITRFHYLEGEGIRVSRAIEKSLRVSMVRHFLSDQLEFIGIAKNHIQISDYYELVKRVIFPARSHGKLGGKSAGLFLASLIINNSQEHKELFEKIKTPRTWYITSDGLIDFLHYNDLEGVWEQKYKEMDEINVEYPNIIQIFKNSFFSPEIMRGLSIAIDELGDAPIIVRSSSLLEDRLGAAFSGKYKSLFLANQGSKEEKLEALTDAIAEVYASTFGPDPIEYRTERGLLDYHEEMGIMIQEVVGTRVGNYFLPTFAGVAFSNNEFRWSARINREDGLIRLVPGLGTRAVDRVSNDYPILIAPGKPSLRVNVTPDEIIRYSSKNIDVINLDTNAFETIGINDLIKKFGNDLPGIQNVVSTANDHLIQKPTSLLNIDFENDNLVVTFEGLFQRTDFIKQLHSILYVLEKSIGTPVDIEFAHDGHNLYLLQCRPQSYGLNIQPASIPKDIPQHKIVFSAKRYVSNGYVPDITHVVYVDAAAYNSLTDLNEMKTVGRIVGRLNKILPKRQFILMGPGRWGSRGDIKLGVDVTYSDINNTAVLIEIARQKGNYVPELSFGTHFFQDLVEASIRYLPLYPDNEGIIFNEDFFMKSENILADLLPEFASFADTVRVIDVPRSIEGHILRVLMNAELDEAVGFLAEPSTSVLAPQPDEKKQTRPRNTEDSWRWRYNIAERIATYMDPERFGVKGLYVFGSTKNASARPDSDIDLLVHFNGNDAQQKELLAWLEGWSLTLAELNYQRTGYKSDGLLDIYLVTDEDIKNKTSYAVKIGAVTDAAKPLPLRMTNR